MKVNFEDSEGAHVVRISGRLSAIEAQELEKTLFPIAEKIQDGGTLLLDLKTLDYISSAGLRTLLLAAKTLKGKGGTLALCALQDAVREVFNIAGFTELFPIYDSEETALRECAAS